LKYCDRLDAHALPVMRGNELNADRPLRREVIQTLMCDFELDFTAIEARHDIRFAEYLRPDLAALVPLAADGLAEVGAPTSRSPSAGACSFAPSRYSSTCRTTTGMIRQGSCALGH
jgi:oxygen-independent coproporphyrinogen III oxidase